MADTSPTPNGAHSERRQIIARGAVAAGLVVALLAGLLIFEREERGEPAPVVRTITRPASPASAPAASPPALSPELAAAIEKAPSAAEAALATMSSPPPVAPASVVPEETLDPTVPMAGERNAASRGSRAAMPAAAPPAASSPAATLAARPGGNFLVQLGVFANVANAEELRASLAQQGIPAQLETRVQVGPFATRREARQAQEKLRQMGLGEGILMAAHKR